MGKVGKFFKVELSNTYASKTTSHWVILMVGDINKPTQKNNCMPFPISSQPYTSKGHINNKGSNQD